MGEGPETAHRATYWWAGHSSGIPSGRCKGHVKLQGRACSILRTRAGLPTVLTLMLMTGETHGL
jgi:hypothetical protein